MRGQRLSNLTSRVWWIGSSCLAALAFATSGAGLGHAQTKPSVPTADSQYVGSETCKTCHAPQSQSFDHGKHWNVVLPAKTGAEGCETCHGPGRAHVESGGEAAKIVNPRKLKAREASQICLTCHQTSQTHANFVRSQHAKNNVGCNDCHSVHQAATPQLLLRAATPKLCYSCHAEVLPDFSKPSHHRVNEGLIKCADCHDVHGSVMPHQVRASHFQQATCVGCHQDKAGPFQFEHAPVKIEGCTSCHTPHGSSNPHLLTRPNTNQLCLSCHSEILASSSAPITPTFHNQTQKYQSCTLCHVAVHGSNTDQFFFRR